MTEWIGGWITARLTDVRLLEQRTPRVVFEHAGDVIAVCAITSSRVTEAEVAHALAAYSDTKFIVNTDKNAFYEGEALNLCESRRVGLGELGELMSFLGRGQRDHIQRSARFVLRGLRQHVHVAAVSRLNNRMFAVTRNRDLRVFQVLQVDDYIVTAESVRHSIQVFGVPYLIVSTNPNRTITVEALAAADSIGLRILTWAELLKEIPRWN